MIPPFFGTVLSILIPLNPPFCSGLLMGLLWDNHWWIQWDYRSLELHVEPCRSCYVTLLDFDIRSGGVWLESQWWSFMTKLCGLTHKGLALLILFWVVSLSGARYQLWSLRERRTALELCLTAERFSARCIYPVPQRTSVIRSCILVGSWVVWPTASLPWGWSSRRKFRSQTSDNMDRWKA